MPLLAFAYHHIFLDSLNAHRSGKLMKIIDGKAIADSIEDEIKLNIERLHKQTDAKPGLAMILVGVHPASLSYVTMKKKACLKAGMQSFVLEFPDTISEKELLHKIDDLNQDANVHGILVQLPLPRHIDPIKVTYAINPNKDVDGFHPLNVGKLLLGLPGGFLPCTPNGIKVLLEHSHVDIKGKHVVIVGRSNIVGKPLAAILMQNNPHCNATVTITHSFTRNLPDITLQADILVAAIGVPEFVTKDMVKDNAIVIDVGINRVSDPEHPKGYRIVGDVDFFSVAEKCQAITPVPKGVGPMTIAMLLQNTLLSFQRTLHS